jgi:hypothetical protein
VTGRGSREKNECLGVPWPHDGEVTTVERGDIGDSKALGDAGPVHFDEALDGQLIGGNGPIESGFGGRPELPVE